MWKSGSGLRAARERASTGTVEKFCRFPQANRERQIFHFCPQTFHILLWRTGEQVGRKKKGSRGRSQTGPPVAGALSFHTVGAALAAARLTDCVFFVGADSIRPLYLGIKRYAGYGGFRLRATYFARGGKAGKAPPGAGVRKNTSCFYAACPYPLSLALLDISP